MSSNAEKVREKYQDGLEDKRAVQSRYGELEFIYTKKHLDEYIRPETAVIELGCGAGYYAAQFAGRCKSYLGVDLVPENVALLQEKIQSGHLENVEARVGDATDLTGIPDQSFDLVLCLGPLYHLPSEERELVFAECKRICRPGGTAAFAYINKVGVYAGACVQWDIYPTLLANQRVLQESRDDLRPELFYFAMPEEMEQTAKKYGFSKLKNLGTDFFMMQQIVENASEEKYELMKPLLDAMASYESCTGMSNHALLICRKEG